MGRCRQKKEVKVLSAGVGVGAGLVVPAVGFLAGAADGGYSGVAGFRGPAGGAVYCAAGAGAPSKALR